MKLIWVALLLFDGLRLPTTGPETVPAEPAEPTVVSTLEADQFYVVEADAPLFVLQSPGGMVTVTDDVGPLRLRGRFAGGDGRTETRTYPGPHVYTFEAVKPGTVELFFVPAGVTEAAAIRSHRLTVMASAPRPPTPPVDPPTPPDVDPDVERITGPLQVLIIEESADRGKLKPGQLDAMFAVSVREYIETHARKRPDGSPDFYMLDKDANLTGKPEWVQNAMAMERSTLPWIVFSNDHGGQSVAVPDSPAAMLALLRKYGGP